MRVLICPDKFKGSLSALDACRAMAEGVRMARPDAEIELLPIADGGEGTVQAFCHAFGGTIRKCLVHDALGREVQSFFGALPDGSAVLELAAASGLQWIAAQDRNPSVSNTFGTGELMLAAAAAGASRLIVGLGGSATNDAGVGMAAALGYRFLDSNENEVRPVPEDFLRISKIVPPADWHLPRTIALCDVTNPLIGPDGATYVYGPQKGVQPGQLKQLDDSLSQIARLVARDLGIDPSTRPGAGAAGGMGYGLMAFAGAELKSGFNVIAEVICLNSRIQRADLVLTGEGKLDLQSVAGKGPSGVAEMARANGKRVICIPGAAEGAPGVSDIFDRVLPLVREETTLEMAMAEPARLLAERAAEAVRDV